MEINRRKFLKTGILAAGALPVHGAFKSQKEVAGNIEGFTEPSRILPIAKETDVIVCGGGPAGLP